jgi:hypothetical protein
MPTLVSKAGQPAIGKLLLIGGLGLLFGLLFGLPPAMALCSAGLPWIPWGLAGFIPGLIVANMLACLVVKFVLGVPLPKPSDPLVIRRPRKCAPSCQRLADAAATLELLDVERKRRRDSHYEKRVEDRIIWNELLDLELQDIDEQISRISGSNPTKGGPS